MPFIPQSAHRARPCISSPFRRLLAYALVLALIPAVTVPAFAAPGDPVLYEQTDARVIWAGAWAQGAAEGVSGGSQALSNAGGASATFTFLGTGFELRGMTGPKSGIATVAVDGGVGTAVDCYAPATVLGATLHASSGLDYGLHTVTFSVTGERSAPATDAFVSLDAVVVSGQLVSAAVEESDRRIARRGRWASPVSGGLSGGTHLLSNTAGDEIVVEFSGTSLDLVAMTGPKFGIASVAVDGAAPVDVDMYSAATHLRQVVFSTGTLAAGTHVVRLTVSGRKNAASADTYVGLDALLPVGTLQQAVVRYEESDPRFAYNGELHAQENASLSGGRYMWAGATWGAVAVTFNGGRFDWIGATGPQFGIASVRIDGGPAQYVDLYSPSMQLQQTVYTSGTLPYGTHTVVISWTGRKNAASSGNLISYDAFGIGGEPLQAAAPAIPPEAINFNYPWARYIVVDKSELKLYYVVNGAVVKVYPCATGKLSTPTPNATWRIDAKYYTDPTSVYGPRKMRMFRQTASGYVFTAYAIHGTNVDSSIGTYASHGCVRMHNYDVLEFFDMVPLGTMVITRD